MESFSLRFKPSVEKDLRSLTKQILLRVRARIDNLALEPFPRQSIKLSGAERLYRLRVGDYRVVYEVDVQAKQITIHYVRHRRDIYDAL